MPPRTRKGKIRSRRTGKTVTASHYPRKDGGWTAKTGAHKGKRVSRRDYAKDRSLKSRAKAMPKGYGYRTDKTRPKKSGKRRSKKK